MMSSKRPCHCHDESVYANINGCKFIPGASYERLFKRITMPESIVRVFQSDNGYLRAVAFSDNIRIFRSDNGYLRTVAFSDNRQSSSYAGILVDRWGMIIHQQAREGSDPMVLPSLEIILRASTGINVWEG